MKSLLELIYPSRFDCDGNKLKIGDIVEFNKIEDYRYTILDLTPRGIRVLCHTYGNKYVDNPTSYRKVNP